MSRKIVKKVLMDKLDIAIRQVVTYFLEQYGEEEIFAMCFRMHSEINADIKWRYLCEPIVQTRAGYETSASESGDDEFLLDYKYNPEEYRYAESEGTADVLSGFREVQSYLSSNGLDFKKYKAIDDIDERDEMYEKLMNEAFEIDKIMAEVIAKLREEKKLVNSDGKEFYVFPYVEEEEPAEKIITLAKIMNYDLDLTEYIEFWDYE